MDITTFKGGIPVHFPENPEEHYCDRCREMMSPKGLAQLVSEGGFEHLSKTDCKANALFKKGCPLCMTIDEHYTAPWEGSLFLFLSPGIGDLKRPWSWRYKTPGPAKIVTALVQAQVQGSKPEKQSSFLVGRGKRGPPPHEEMEQIVRIKLFAEESNPAAQFIASRPILGYKNQSKVFAAARVWLERCRHEHTGRCPANIGVELPTRLIDTGDNTIFPDVRLRESQPGEIGEYIALSYCWGGPQPVTATVNNLDALTQRIALSSLPQTLQDAVLVTRNIGQRYLWIDALCIIQDSDEDKQREIQKMGLIYKNAVLTIAAAVADNVSEGFLKEQPGALPSCKWEFDVPGVGLHTIHISAYPTADSCWPVHPLDRRGWTLQERVLSCRMLVFSQHEPLWHCRAVQLETPVENGYLKYAYSDTLHPALPFIGSTTSGEVWSSRTARRDLWANVVHNFTVRALTVKDDRLNAVAGIAAELQALWQDECLYGHWKQCFVELLLWKHFGSPRNAPIARSGRAPSWSWASLDCPVQFVTNDWPNIEATARVTFTDDAPPLVLLTCKVIKLETADTIGSLGVDVFPSYMWDLALHVNSAAHHPGAVLMLLGSNKRESGGVWDARGIIGLPGGCLSGGFQRVGYFEMSVFGRGWRALWGAIQPVEVHLQ